MTIPRSPINDAIIIAYLALAMIAFLNLFVRGAFFGISSAVLALYVRSCDPSIPLVFSPNQLAAIRRFMLRKKALPNQKMEAWRKYLVADEPFRRLLVSVWILAGTIVTGLVVLTVAFRVWPCAVTAVVVLPFFALFAFMLKMQHKKMVAAFDPTKV